MWLKLQSTSISRMQILFYTISSLKFDRAVDIYNDHLKQNILGVCQQCLSDTLSKFDITKDEGKHFTW